MNSRRTAPGCSRWPAAGSQPARWQGLVGSAFYFRTRCRGALGWIRARLGASLPGSRVARTDVAGRGCCRSSPGGWCGAMPRRPREAACSASKTMLRGDAGRLSPAIVPVKFAGGVLALGAGLALGREGPTVQMAAALGAGHGRGYSSCVPEIIGRCLPPAPEPGSRPRSMHRSPVQSLSSRNCCAASNCASPSRRWPPAAADW